MLANFYLNTTFDFYRKKYEEKKIKDDGLLLLFILNHRLQQISFSFESKNL